MLVTLCLTGCGKQQGEEVPVETKPSIVTKNDVIGGTKAGDEEEKRKPKKRCKEGLFLITQMIWKHLWQSLT